MVFRARWPIERRSVSAVHHGVEGGPIDAALVAALVEVVAGAGGAALFGFFESPAVDCIKDAGDGAGLAAPGGLGAVPGGGASGAIGRTLQVSGLGQTHGFAVDIAS
jgi:hypothetical protein